MKPVRVTLLLIISTFAFGQNKYSEYRNVKKTIELNTGIRMSYIDKGDQRGKPLILLHGYTDTSRSFQLLIEELLKIRTDIRIIAPDLRGHVTVHSPMRSSVQKIRKSVLAKTCLRMMWST